GAGGAKPSRKAATLTVASAPEASERAESWFVVRIESRSARVIRALAVARKRIRRLATVGWPRPACQRLVAATAESTVQWTKKTATNAWKTALRGSPDCGIEGSANVQTTRIALSATR